MIRRILIGLGFFLHALIRFSNLAPDSNVIGVVYSRAGPVSNATVGWRGESLRVTTDERGRFRLPRSPHSRNLVASKSGHAVASLLHSEYREVALKMEHLPEADNEKYTWINPHPDPKREENCANCHAEIYREWLGSAHAGSATNPRFLSLHHGAPSVLKAGEPRTEFETWNAKREHPEGSNVCWVCHIAPNPVGGYSAPRVDQGIERKSGIHCDYCHKVRDVPDGKFGRRFGFDALEFLRYDDLTFGPLDDAVRKGESFGHAPVYKESRYCASCHEGTVLGVHAYGTYSEWLESPAKARGNQCQDCHMAPTGKMTNIAPGKGGIERDPKTLASHNTQGAHPEMLRKALSLKLIATKQAAGRGAEVQVAAHHVGHRVPTGFVDRQIILLLSATDANKKTVEVIDGPHLPANAGNWNGKAGVLFAKQLIGEKGKTPIPFWIHVDKVVDTRLLPEETQRHTFLFSGSATSVTAQLWYRRFWHEVAQARGWTDNDTLVAEETLHFADLPR